jgi:hypothetical protein
MTALATSRQLRDPELEGGHVGRPHGHGEPAARRAWTLTRDARSLPTGPVTFLMSTSRLDRSPAGSAKATPPCCRGKISAPPSGMLGGREIDARADSSSRLSTRAAVQAAWRSASTSRAIGRMRSRSGPIGHHGRPAADRYRLCRHRGAHDGSRLRRRKRWPDPRLRVACDAGCHLVSAGPKPAVRLSGSARSAAISWPASTAPAALPGRRDGDAGRLAFAHLVAVPRPARAAARCNVPHVTEPSHPQRQRVIAARPDLGARACRGRRQATSSPKSDGCGARPTTVDPGERPRCSSRGCGSGLVPVVNATGVTVHRSGRAR